MRILIVEDEKNLCDMIGKSLHSAGYEVDLCYDGEDALEMIMAGATAVAVGTANFHNPYATVEIIKGIEEYMQANGVDDINALIGCVK